MPIWVCDRKRGYCVGILFAVLPVRSKCEGLIVPDLFPEEGFYMGDISGVISHLVYRSFKYEWDLSELWVVHDAPESVVADISKPYMLMPVKV